MFVNRVPSLKIKMFILEPWVDLKYSPTLVTASRTRTRRNPEILKTFEGEKFCSRLMTSGKKSGKKNTSQLSVKSTSDKTSKMSSELTKKKTLRTGHRNSAERKLECANEILNSLGDDPWSVSKQRATLIFYKSSLKEKLDVIQGLKKSFSIYQRRKKLSVSEIEETDQFCSHVELVLARLDEVLTAISPKIEVRTLM